MIRFNSHRYQFLIGVLLIIVSGILLRNAANALHENRAAAFLIPQSTIQGSHTWSLRKGALCFAELKTKLAIVDNALTLSIDAVSLVSLRGDRNKLFATGFIQFNSLQQIFATLFTFGSDFKQWQIGSAGVTPMHWTLKSLGAEAEPAHYKGTLPGPFTMSSTNDLQYEITHPLFSSGSFWPKNNAASAIFKKISVMIEESPCSEAEMKALPVDAFINNFETLLQRVPLFTR